MYEEWLYRTFGRIRKQVNPTAYSLGLISWSDLKAFTELTKTELSPREVDAIMALDQVYVGEVTVRMRND